MDHILNIDKDTVGLAKVHDPITSKEAAALVDAPKLMLRVYIAMRKYGDSGCISDNVADDLPDIANQTFTPRFRQMVERGMIEVTGEKRKGHKCGKMQEVRKILPPPFHPRKKIKTIPIKAQLILAHQTIDSIRVLKKTRGWVDGDDLDIILEKYDETMSIK
jgi:hypothetical protein